MLHVGCQSLQWRALQDKTIFLRPTYVVHYLGCIHTFSWNFEISVYKSIFKQNFPNCSCTVTQGSIVWMCSLKATKAVWWGRKEVKSKSIAFSSTSCSERKKTNGALRDWCSFVRSFVRSYLISMYTLWIVKACKIPRLRPPARSLARLVRQHWTANCEITHQGLQREESDRESL